MEDLSSLLLPSTLGLSCTKQSIYLKTGRNGLFKDAPADHFHVLIAGQETLNFGMSFIGMVCIRW